MTVLSVRSLRTGGDVVRACRAAPGSDVRIDYRHSVEKTPVQGRFTVNGDRRIIAVETRFTSTGTGLPNTAVDRTHRDGAWYVVDEQRLPVDPLRFYLQPVNRTRLSVDGAAVDLAALPPGTLLGIRVERVSGWRWWRWLVTGTGWKEKANEQ